MANLTMGHEGTQFFGDGVNLSWPKGGEREIVPAPATLSRRILRRIAEGMLVQTNEPSNRPAYVPPSSRLLNETDAKRFHDRLRARRKRTRIEATAEMPITVEEVHEPVQEPVVASAVQEPAVATRAPARRRTTRRTTRRKR